nr:hypothetical protein [Tanacetum cinerariifolium]
MGLRVADSYTGNRHEDDFTPLETIRSFLFIFGSRSLLARREGLQAEGEGTSSSSPVKWVDGEFHFEPEGGIGNGEGSSPSTRSVNNETPVIDVDPLNSTPPSKVAENIGDSDDSSLEKDVANEAEKLCKSLKATSKRKQIAESSGKETHHNFEKCLLKRVKLMVMLLIPLMWIVILTFMFPSAKELKDFVDCHWVVAHMTPLSWKQHLKEISLEKLYDIESIRDRIWTRILLCWTCVQRLRPYKGVQLLCFEGAFNLEKIPCYSSSSKKEFNQAGDDLATASYPFIAKVIADPYASVEDLISKKLKSLRTKPAPLYSKHSSSKVKKIYGEYSRLVIEEKKSVNYEQTLSILRSKFEGLKSERERLKSSKPQLLQEIDMLRQDKAVVVSKVVPDLAT